MNLELPYIQESAYGMLVTVTQYSASYPQPSHTENVKSYILEILPHLRLKLF